MFASFLVFLIGPGSIGHLGLIGVSRRSLGSAWRCFALGTRTGTKTNTNPFGIEAIAAGKSVLACFARESKREVVSGLNRHAPRALVSRSLQGNVLKLTEILARNYGAPRRVSS
jgi:hypothetical protein